MPANTINSYSSWKEIIWRKARSNGLEEGRVLCPNWVDGGSEKLPMDACCPRDGRLTLSKLTRVMTWKAPVADGAGKRRPLQTALGFWSEVHSDELSAD